LSESDPHTITHLLHDWRKGNAGALDRLLPLVYDELHRIARRLFVAEPASHTLQPTAVLHEAYMRLLGAEVDWSDRAHFYAIASREMRRVLVDHARRRSAARRGGDWQREPISEGAEPPAPEAPDLLRLDEALTRLHAEDERMARCVELHYFGAMDWNEIAEVLGVSRSTVARDLRVGKAWLWRELAGGAPAG
jgi:RNA polymerase sigma factor (TIGR02999 family)